jgi:hypothetical protein
MTNLPDVTAWQEANDAYLGAAVEWLRLLLAFHAAAPEPHIVASEARATPRSDTAAANHPPSSPWWTFRRADAAAAAPAPQLALPPASTAVTRQQVDEAAQRMRTAAAADPPSALSLLAHRLSLSSFESDVLLLCVAMELDTRIPSLCAAAQGDASRPFPTFALAMGIFDAPGWDVQSPERPLRYFRLIEINQTSAQPFTASPLRADERIVNFVKGLSYLDDRIAPFVSLLGETVHDSDLPPSQRDVVERMLQAIDHDHPHLRPLQLLGRDSDSKQLVALAAAHRLGLTVYRMDAEMLPSQATDIETLARLWQLSTILLPVALYVDAHEVERASESHATPLKRFLARTGGVLFVETRETWPVPQGSHSFDVAKPTPIEQRALWLAALGPEHRDEAVRMAAQFNLSAAAIERIVANAQDGDPSIPLGDRLWSLALAETRLRVDALAQRIESKAKWDDLVLPPAEKALLQQIAAHVSGRGIVYDDWGFREQTTRGLGISALFAGESGTGKTMAAEVLANELGLSLHRIDLSAVLSKWVGVTEQNLQQLFNAADDASGILFFDEADALFGKRTEVQHSQDRFANIEINFLLQRLESYRGLAILATNMRSAIDPAFLRRLRFIVTFPFPGPAERRDIWRRAFPDATPTEGLDIDRLAKLSLTGASVRNVALSAAFLAAQRGTAVTMPIVLEAARTEVRKLDKPVTDTDFKWTPPQPALTATTPSEAPQS